MTTIESVEQLEYMCVVLPIIVLFILTSILFVFFTIQYFKTKETRKPSKETKAVAPKPEEHHPEVSWQERLQLGLRKTRQYFEHSFTPMIRQKKIDENLLENIYEVLYRADLGVGITEKFVERIRQKFSNQVTEWKDIQPSLQTYAEEILAQGEQPLNVLNHKPAVILIVGVNGVGKTTTIAKLASNYMAKNKKVLLAAGDTFRAGAIDQLKVWAQRLSTEIVAHDPGGDPAAVIFDAISAANSRQFDVLLADTAGRLHNKNNLMDELSKIQRVMGRALPGAPHEIWLVLDATTGQNAVQQVKAFKETVPLTGLIVSKLDGTAKGGILLSICEQFSLPIRYIGVGETADDLREFKSLEYAKFLF